VGKGATSRRAHHLLVVAIADGGHVALCPPAFSLEISQSRVKITGVTSMQSEIPFEAGRYRCIAVRSDTLWGHGLKVSIHSSDGLLLNVVTFRCHPEFPSFEILQAMNTQQLIELAVNELKTGELESHLLKAREAKIQLFVTFKIAPE
jgi:hypothetical protein